MARGGVEHRGNIGDSETETFNLEIKDGVVHLELFLGEPKGKWGWLEFPEEVGRFAQKLLKKK